MTTAEVVRRLFATEASARPDLSATDLSRLDLSELDFKGAVLREADLFGVDLSSSNLRGADLGGARLDRTIVIRTDFSGAQMQASSLLGLSAFTSMSFDANEAPLFRGANLARAKLLARLDGADFSGADVTETNFAWAPFARGLRSWGAGLSGCCFDGVTATRAHFAELRMKFCRFRDANLQYANFADADLSGADFSNADVSHARFTGAVLTDARLDSLRGRHLAEGL